MEGGGSQWVGEKGFTELEHFFEKMQTHFIFYIDQILKILLFSRANRSLTLFPMYVVNFMYF